MTSHWSELVGNIPAADVLDQYHATRRGSDQTLAAWMEWQSLALWAASEEGAPNWQAAAEQLLGELAAKYGTVQHAGREYTLTTIADYSNRPFPGWWGDASEGEPYTAEFSATAVDSLCDAYVVYWQFDAVKGEEPPLDGWPWDDAHIKRVVVA